MDSPNQPPTGQTSPEFQDAIRRAKRHSQAFTGVILVVVGLLFLVDRMGWEWGWHLSFRNLWPVLLIVFGIGVALSHRDQDVVMARTDDGRHLVDVRGRGRRRWSDGLFAILCGVLMLLHVNHVVYISQTWPLFVVAVGITMMFGRGRWSRREGR